MTLPHPDTNATDNFVRVYGAELHYFEAEQGPLVMLLHGLFGNAWQWSNIMERLAKHLYVIALDQIGLGWSDKPFLNYRTATKSGFPLRLLSSTRNRATFPSRRGCGWIGCSELGA